MKIAALIALNSDCRFMSLLAEGLIQHPEVKPAFSSPIIQVSTILAKDSRHFLDDLRECDYILRPMDGYTHRLQQEHVKLIDDEDLWHKVIIYDPKDEPWQMDEGSLNKAFLYFKRSITGVKKYSKPIYPSNQP